MADHVATAGAYVRVGGYFPFMVAVAEGGDRLPVIRLGGHSLPRESPWKCVVRELREEASLTIRPAAPPATYWVEVERDERLAIAPWSQRPDEPAPPLLVAWQSHATCLRLSVMYLAESEGEPIPSGEVPGLLLLRTDDVFRLTQESLTLDEFCRSGGRVLVRDPLPRNLPLEPFLQLRILAELLARHPGLAPT